MPMLARVRGLLRSLAGRGPIQRDLDADIGGCFDMLVDEKTAAGMSPEEARREARLELGGVEQVKEAVRAVRPAAWLDTIVRDVRYSARLLAKTPAFSLTAVLVLALGIGANSAAFSLINVLLFRPLPGESRPGIAVAIYTHDPSKPDSYRAFSYREYEEIRDSRGPFDYVMAHGAVHPTVVDGGLTRGRSCAT